MADLVLSDACIRSCRTMQFWTMCKAMCDHKSFGQPAAADVAAGSDIGTSNELIIHGRYARRKTMWESRRSMAVDTKPCRC